jgi:hypothetical protein
MIKSTNLYRMYLNVSCLLFVCLDLYSFEGYGSNHGSQFLSVIDGDSRRLVEMATG